MAQETVCAGSDLIARARETRAAARRFAEAVRRFGAEMPGHLDRFHQAMAETRRTARRLQGAPVEAGAASTAEVVPLTRRRPAPSAPAATAVAAE